LLVVVAVVKMALLEGVLVAIAHLLQPRLH
jgi:hypothetical protein